MPKVRALQNGYYQDYRRARDEFEVEDGVDLSWAEPIQEGA